jgi:hypothetical protein
MECQLPVEGDVPSSPDRFPAVVYRECAGTRITSVKMNVVNATRNATGRPASQLGRLAESSSGLGL